jgi:hypothetical protein
MNVFHSDVRASLRSTLDDLGNGLQDRGEKLRAAFVEVRPLLRAADASPSRSPAARSW